VRRPAVWLATGFGVGFIPFAPATWASLATTLVFFLAYPASAAPVALAVAILALFPVAVWASGEAERDLGRDAHPIVIDEVLGMLVTLWGVSFAGRVPLALGLGFLLFRAFDIVKPYPIRQSQDLPGGWGVVVDDLLAGIASNLVLRLALRFLP
jgi:phosphatidylglycerophosphatase A